MTPSYAPDAPLFADLHRSVLAFTPESTIHHVVVPDSDRGLFAAFAGPRCRIWTVRELLPRRFVDTPFRAWWVNVRRPWPPVRGWVLQQALKIALAARLPADVVLVVDSDVVLARPIDATTFSADGLACLYRLDGAVHDGMRRHVAWHQVARRLLGLPESPPPPLPDYICPFNFWEPPVVRAMQHRLTEVTGRHWLEAVTAEVHISEFMLYGLFVDLYLLPGPSRPVSRTELCHDYWGTTPLDTRAAAEFVDRMPPNAVAMMISAKSGTPQEVNIQRLHGV